MRNSRTPVCHGARLGQAPRCCPAKAAQASEQRRRDPGRWAARSGTQQTKPVSSAETGTLPPLSCLWAAREQEGGPGRKGWGLPAFTIHNNPPEAFPPRAMKASSKCPGKTTTLYCRHGPPSNRKVKERGVHYNSAGLELHKSKAKPKAKALQGRLRWGSTRKVPESAGRAGSTHPAVPPRRPDQHGRRGLFADESGGSTPDCRFDIQRKGEMRLHPRAHLKARSFCQPESGGKPRDGRLEHLGRFKKLCFTPPPEIKGAERSNKGKVRRAGARQATSFGFW